MATVTPNYSWPVPTSSDYVKDGASAIEALGDAIDATVFGLGTGLTLIKTQTIGTAVSTVTVTNAFSATYDVYQIIIRGANGSNDDNNVYLKFNNSTGSTYNYGGQVVNNAGVSGIVNTANSSVGMYCILTGSQTNISSRIEVFNPFAANNTAITAQFSGQNYGGNITGQDKNAVSQTGFIISAPSSTLTGGTIYVYGYKKA
jgi:hypothetical protein